MMLVRGPVWQGSPGSPCLDLGSLGPFPLHCPQITGWSAAPGLSPALALAGPGGQGEECCLHVGASLLSWAGRGGGIICGPVRANSEAILATEKTGGQEKGLERPAARGEGQGPGQGVPQKRAGGGLLSTASPYQDVIPAGTFVPHIDVSPEAPEP